MVLITCEYYCSIYIHSRPSGKNQKLTNSRKIDAYSFWDSQGPILEHYQERGSIINSTRYREMLIGWLKPEIRSRRRGQLSKGIVLLHDNARPHTAAHTVETLQKLNFEVLAHPPYSPYLAPSGYHLFGTFKEALRNRRFTSNQELKEAVLAWLAAQPKTFFSEGIKKLVQQWKKCIETQGDYVEKLCYYKFSVFIEMKFVSVVRIIIVSPT